MPTEEKIRAFLLGMADPKTEETIEEGILDGSVATDDLLVIEEELIDDHVFSRLTPDEERAFHENFLINQERREGLNFSRALRKYAMEHAPGMRWRQRSWLDGFPRLVLAASLSVSGLAAITVVWLGIRDARVSRELALVSRNSDERQRLLTSLEEEERQRAIADAGKIFAGAPAPGIPASKPAAEPGIQLRPGVRRGVEAIPVLHVQDQAGAVRITLELAFDPQAGLHEELTRAGGERIWTQELSSSAQTAGHGETTIYLPAELLSPGDYQIRLKDMTTDASDEGDVYAFRVTRP